jgi:N-acetylglucosaminyl-diphospho-decaprenol L-rhamnosyltransferase
VARLSAIIVSFNTREKTLRCLSALFSDAPTVETIVVDNGSTDGSADAIEARYPAVSVVRSSVNLGFSAANNLAIRQATADLILLLNSDAYIGTGAVAALIEFLEANPKVAAVGPQLSNLDGSLQRSCFKFPGPGRSALDFLLVTAAVPNHRKLGDYRAWPHDSNRIVDFVTGACMLIRRSALDDVGLLDENFFFYFEEADWCLRATRAGWLIAFTPTARVLHEGGGSGKARPLAVFQEFQRGHERFIAKHFGSGAVKIHLIALGIGAALRLSIFHARQFFKVRDDGALIQQWQQILRWCLSRGGEAVSCPEDKGLDHESMTADRPGSSLGSTRSASDLA